MVSGSGTVRCRLVGAPMPTGSYRFFLTNLPQTVGPHQISDLYRVRWEIESDNKLDKSCFHLDTITAQTPHAVRALVHASMVGSIIANLIAHRHRMTEAPSAGEHERTQPPIHPPGHGPRDGLGLHAHRGGHGPARPSGRAEVAMDRRPSLSSWQGPQLAPSSLHPRPTPRLAHRPRKTTQS